MSSLSQSADAACPDFSADESLNPQGLRVSLTPGTHYVALNHTPANPLDNPSASLMLAARPDLTGSLIVPLRGIDSQGQETFRLEVSPDTQGVAVIANPAHSAPTALQTTLPTLPRWTAISLALDTDSPSPSLSLRLNGLPVTTSPLQSLPNATTTLQIGSPRKHADTTGTLDLDQLSLVDGPLANPLPLPPVTQPHAGDPAHWLVIYNTNLPDSVAWADHYRQARRIPHANLLGLPLPNGPSLTPTEYAGLLAAVTDYLDTNALRSRILGILTGFGVPALVIDPQSTLPQSTANLLASDDPHFSVLPNPCHAPPPADGSPPAHLPRPTRQSLTPQGAADHPLRLAASIDVPSLTHALAMTDRSLHLSAHTLSAHAPDRICIDPYPDPLGTDPVYEDQLLSYAQSIHAGHLRLPISLAAPPDSEAGHPTANRFDQLTHDAIHLTLRADPPPTDYFASPADSRACSLALHLAPPTPITSLREAHAPNWLQAPIEAGYAAAIAPVLNASPDWRPHAPSLLEALRLGYTLAEALTLALPTLRAGYLLLGDPLLTVTTPQTGYDRFGPLPLFSTLETLNPNQPTQRLHAADDPFDRPSLPAADGQYVIRAIDPQGRSDAGLTLLQGQAQPNTPPPAWPDAPHWPVLRFGQHITLPLLLSERHHPHTTLTLEQDPNPKADPPAVVTPSPGNPRLLHRLDTPPQPTRFRWVVTQPHHTPAASPWSMIVSPASPLHA